jgi:hypothetical protein
LSSLASSFLLLLVVVVVLLLPPRLPVPLCRFSALACR